MTECSFKEVSKENIISDKYFILQPSLVGNKSLMQKWKHESNSISDDVIHK